MRDEQKIRDLNDRPIYLAALVAKVDGILTDDKDFLDSGIDHPKMLTAAEVYAVGIKRKRAATGIEE